jgi:hypothetical protein
MSHKDDRSKNSLMNENFVDVVAESRKLSQHKCKHCEYQFIKSAAREQQHLKLCDAFKREQERKKKTTLSKNSIQLFITSFIRSLSQAQIAQAHRAAAMSVYMTNLSFNHFENSYIVFHMQMLSSSYKSLFRKLLAGKLLDEVYDIIKFKVDKMLNSCNHLSFFTDETVNIRKERVVNLCCHVSSKSDEEFHLKATIEVTEKMSAVVQAD